MGSSEIQESAELQQRISQRLAELAYADIEGAQRLARDIAEVVVTARNLSANTLPLFLQMDVSNAQALGSVAVAIKLQLEAMTDALVDLRQEMPEWSEFFSSMSVQE